MLLQQLLKVRTQYADQQLRGQGLLLTLSLDTVMMAETGSRTHARKRNRLILTADMICLP